MKRFVMPLLLVSAAFVSPAYANYFSNPVTGVNLNVGSAPNPTPEDIRESRTPVVADVATPAPDAVVAAAGEKQDTPKITNGGHEHDSPQPSSGTGVPRSTSPSR
jgi:hypothetical protein